jgi:hypothetical protein
VSIGTIRLAALDDEANQDCWTVLCKDVEFFLKKAKKKKDNTIEGETWNPVS